MNHTGLPERHKACRVFITPQHPTYSAPQLLSHRTVLYTYTHTHTQAPLMTSRNNTYRAHHRGALLCRRHKLKQAASTRLACSSFRRRHCSVPCTYTYTRKWRPRKRHSSRPRRSLRRRHACVPYKHHVSYMYPLCHWHCSALRVIDLFVCMCVCASHTESVHWLSVCSVGARWHQAVRLSSHVYNSQ